MAKKSKKDDKEKPYRKANIPKAIRAQCWIQTMGKAIENGATFLGVKISSMFLISTLVTMFRFS